MNKLIEIIIPFFIIFFIIQYNNDKKINKIIESNKVNDQYKDLENELKLKKLKNDLEYKIYKQIEDKLSNQEKEKYEEYFYEEYMDIQNHENYLEDFYNIKAEEEYYKKYKESF